MDLGDKLCMICGGSKLVRRYFGAITCDSCKSFFRRMALKNIQLKCSTDGKCNITANPRKLCQKCRLEKCLAVGMRKEFIKDVKQNEMRKQLIRESKLKQQNCIHYSNTNTEPNEQNMQIESYVTNSDNNNNLIQDSFPLAILPMFQEITDYHGLNQSHCDRILQLFKASSIIDYPLSTNVVEISDRNTVFSLNELNVTGGEQHVRNIVKLIKGLNGFQNICQHDQLLLVQHGCLDLIILRFMKYFNQDTESYIFPMGTGISLSVPLK
ncbi:unnamed protein product, partial [Oppiella nova]